MVDELGPRHSDPVIDLHVPYLLEQARLGALQHPEMRVIGLVADADTPEADDLFKSEEIFHRAEDRSVSALISRESARQHLVRNSPEVLEFFEEEGKGPRRKLTIVHAAKRGLRTATLDYEIAG